MKYIKKYSEVKDNYRVFIEWEHGDADEKTTEYYNFKNEDDMNDFLHFIYDIRHFVPNAAYGNQGYFEDGHYQRERKWVNSIDAKYGNKYSSMIPNDIHYGSNNYTPSVESVHVEISDQPLNIVWKDALKTNIISLPKIGDDIIVLTGHINGASVGPSVFGGKLDDYFDYNDFEHKDLDMPEGEYSEIKCKVADCDISEDYRTHTVKNYSRDGQERLINSYITYYDFVSFGYYVMCHISSDYLSKYLITEKHGYDPKFQLKFHKSMNDYYFV